ncbi:MAG: Gfo/Idh/MocA family oxidoreductase, partial [Spirochaetales bacterium]|nr:Gfo/Idh/MocA family oxidoreductase [Spirochaetales bacterium]
GGIQTCRKLIDEGWIGKPFGSVAFMVGGGPAEFHPSPDFFYKTGGGPLFDMGPYFVTAMINLFGAARKVSAFTSTPYEEKTILGPVRYGEKIKVETPTYINGALEFANGVSANLLTSFDSHGGYPNSGLPFLQIFGTEGTLIVPDPNTFGGPVKVRRFAGETLDMPLSHGFTENSRGIGLSDMAASINAGRKARVSAELAYHALDIMCGFYDSADKGVHVTLESSCSRPEPLARVLPKNSTEA